MPESSSPHWPLIESFLNRVPIAVADAGPEYPRLLSAEAELSSGRRQLVFEASFPGGTANADLFLLVPDDLYVLLAEPSDDIDGNRKRFRVDLSQLGDLSALRRKSIGIVLTDGRRSVKTHWTASWTLGDASEVPATILKRDN